MWEACGFGRCNDAAIMNGDWCLSWRQVVKVCGGDKFFFLTIVEVDAEDFKCIFGVLNCSFDEVNGNCTDVWGFLD